MDYISCDTPIPHYQHQLPYSILPFPAVWSLLQQITVSVIGKTITENLNRDGICGSLFASVSPAPLSATGRASLTTALF